MATTPEGKVKKRLRKALEALRSRKKCKWFMPSASIYGKAGAHDFITCIMGRFVTFETKATKNEKPTDLQIDFALETVAAGGVCYCVHKDNVEEVIREIVLFAYSGTPIQGHDFTQYVRKSKRRTRRRVSKSADNSAGNSDG